MRYIFSIFFTMVLAMASFFFSSQIVHADKSSSQANSSSSQAKQASMFLWADEQMKFIAELAVTKEIKGTWVYYFDGKQIGSQTNAQKSITFSSPSYEAGTPHTVKVTFHGQMGGQELYSSQEIHLPRINILYDRSEKKDHFVINFTNVSKVNGQWGIVVRDQDGNLVDLCHSLFSKDLSYHCKLQSLDEGRYSIYFLFSGTFDKMYPFANYGFMQNGVFTVSDREKPGILKLKKPEISPSKDKIRNLIQEADKTKWDNMDKSNNQYLIAMFIIFVGILSLIRLKLKSFINNLFSR